MTRVVPRIAIALLCTLSVIHASRAEEKPLWELGTGLTVLDFPDYRGSDERTTYALPLVYGAYRGKILNVERERIRGLFFKTDRTSLHLSITGSVPVDSSRNSARQGMPDLDPTLEIGPNLEIRLFRSGDSNVRLDLRLPLRTVIATDFRHTHNTGWTFYPNLNLEFTNTFLGDAWRLGFAAGPLFGDKRYHNYYYGVAPEFAQAGRDTYVADGGYAGIQAFTSLSRRWNKTWFGAFLRWDSVSGAVFETSPLVRQEDTLTAGFAVLRILKESAQTVKTD